MVNLNKTIFALLLAATGLCGCSQNEDLDASNEGEATQGVTGVVFRLQTNTSDASLMTRSQTTEDTDDHTQGTPAEYQVNNARVYLYDNPTKLFVKSVLLTNLKQVGTDASGKIIWESDRISVPQGTYDIFVVANSDKSISQEKEEDFLASIDSTTYARGLITDITNGIVMTNRAADNVGVVLTNTKTSNENVISITLERVLARLDIAKGSESFPLTDENNNRYATVTLDRHYIVNLAKYYYSYRHTAKLTTLEAPTTWTLSENFGKVSDVNGYVIDPYFFKKTISAVNFTNQDKYYQNYFGDQTNPNAIQWTNFKAAAATPDYNTAYCPENCMFQPAQKNGYSTGVLFDAKFVPNNNVYHLNGSTLDVITNTSDYPEILYYYNYKFYDSPEALSTAIGVSSVTAGNLDLYQAKRFQKSDDGYHCYYVYWIRHLDNFDYTKMGVMEFAIVRNNLYRMVITNVSGLGDPEIPSKPDPDKPDEGETYLKVILNVKPWIVRDLTNIVL
jgi:hypothetical protein